MSIFASIQVHFSSSFNASTKVKTATDALNKSINDLKLQGINVYKEEMDLGNTYQITIRIDK